MFPEPSSNERDVVDLQEAFAELSKIMHGTEPLNATLERIAELARATMLEVDEVSMTLLEDGKAKTAVFTGPLAIQLDERQYDAGFGPCLDAAVSGEKLWWTQETLRSPIRTSPEQRGERALLILHLSGCQCLIVS